jgi:mono/diheme cytochrome c family protein/plastocyanin
MVRREKAAFLLVILILLVMPVALLGYQYVLRPKVASVRVIDIQANTPENGGFQPDGIQVAAGETVILRFQSTDVTHGIAIGPGLGIDLGDVDPGQVKEVTLKFSEGGIYTFYCNTWCSPEHWRMRGVVEVIDPAQSKIRQTSVPDPVIARLIEDGVNIDANVMPDRMNSMSTPLLPVQPSAGRGGTILSSLHLPPDIQSLEWRRTHTPAQAVEILGAANPGAAEQDVYDAVAYLWLNRISEQQSADAQSLYNKNCATCHGESGTGDGPNASNTAMLPTNFTDINTMWTMRSDILYAKIRRGGMGTDMPNFGTLFTPEETWELVDYLWFLTLAEGQ